MLNEKQELEANVALDEISCYRFTFLSDLYPCSALLCGQGSLLQIINR